MKKWVIVRDGNLGFFMGFNKRNDIVWVTDIEYAKIFNTFKEGKIFKMRYLTNTFAKVFDYDIAKGIIIGEE